MKNVTNYWAASQDVASIYCEEVCGSNPPPRGGHGRSMGRVNYLAQSVYRWQA